MIALVLEDGGYNVERKFNLGGTKIVSFEAFKKYTPLISILNTQAPLPKRFSKKMVPFLLIKSIRKSMLPMRLKSLNRMALLTLMLY
ncbi:MAG: hypothetical protein U5K54_04825 [Cytophagales bacterium]|nr:hypothetical protein [Cytophagales bacterium]